MKVIRRILTGLGIAAAILGLAALLAFNAGFQTWAVKRSLAGRPQLGATVTRVDAGLQRVRLEGIRVAQPGLVATIPLVEAELPVLTAARGRVQLKSLKATGWTLDLSGRGAAAPAVPVPPAASPGWHAVPAQVAASLFQDILSRLKLPLDVSIGTAELEGEVILATGPGQPPARARVRLDGGGLGAGQEGRFNVSASAALSPTAPVSSVSARGTIEVAMDTPRTFSRMGARLAVEARGTRFPQGTAMTIEMAAGRASVGDSYTLLAEAGGRRLLALRAAHDDAAGAPKGRMSGAWLVDLSDADVMPFALGAALPTFSARGEGRVRTDAAAGTVQLEGTLSLSADRLGAVLAALDPLGPVRGRVEFDLTQDHSVLRIARLAAEVSGAAPVASFRVLQPFELDLSGGTPRPANPAADFARLELPGLPLTWARGFLPAGLAVAGDPLKGGFTLAVRDARSAVLRPDGPLALTRLSVSRNGEVLIGGLDVAVGISADFTAGAWQAEIGSLSVHSGARNLVSLDGKAGRLAGAGQPVMLVGQFRADLAAIAAQPLMAGRTTLGAGEAAATFSASLGEVQEVQAKLLLTGLTTEGATGPVKLPAVEADLRANIARDGRMVLKLPVVLEADGRRSDLLLDGTIARGGGGRVISGRVTSAYLAIDDARVFSGLMRSTPATRAAPPAGPPAPFWAGLSGEVSVALARVVYGGAMEMTDVKGSVRIEGGAVRIAGLGGLGGGSSANLEGGVTFEPAAAMPYGLKASVKVQDFEVGPLFRALNPGREPALEGRFSLASQLSGNAASLGELVSRAQGELQLTSRGGVYRLLEPGFAEKYLKAPSMVSSIGSALGEFTGTRSLSDYSNRIQIVSDIARSLAAIPFHQLSVTASRDENLNIRLRDFILIAPEQRLSGNGMLRHVEGTPLLGRPVELQFQLGARGAAADLLKRAGLLGSEEDNLGYARVNVPLRIQGSLGAPDATALRDVLVKAAEASVIDILRRK